MTDGDSGNRARPRLPVALRYKLAYLLVSALSDPGARQNLSELAREPEALRSWLGSDNGFAEAVAERTSRGSSALQDAPIWPAQPLLLT